MTFLANLENIILSSYSWGTFLAINFIKREAQTFDDFLG